MSEWQPIETAPKDGTPILLYWPHYPDEEKGVVWLGAWKVNDRLAKGYFSDSCEWDDFEMAEPRYAPSHWQPLPPPPKDEPRAVQSHPVETETDTGLVWVDGKPSHITIYDPAEKRDLRINLKAPPTGDMP